MSWFLLLSALVGTGIAAAIGVWIYQHRDIVMAYRLTAEVEVGRERYTGSGVVEVQWRYNPAWLRVLGSGPVRSAHVRGEAVAVDMGRHGILFVTLDGGAVANPQQLPISVFAPGPSSLDTDAFLQRLADIPGIKGIPEGKLPKIVWFIDPADPTSADCPYSQTVRGVRDAQLGLHSVHATLQMVHEPPTSGIGRLLPWLPAARNAPRDNFHRFTIDVGRGTSASHCNLQTTDFQEGF